MIVSERLFFGKSEGKVNYFIKEVMCGKCFFNCKVVYNCLFLKLLWLLLGLIWKSIVCFSLVRLLGL